MGRVSIALVIDDYNPVSDRREVNDVLKDVLIISLVSFFRHSTAADHPCYFISLLLGELPVAPWSSGLQDILHGPTTVLRHHKLGYHDF